MSIGRTAISVLIVLILAVAGNAIWLYEISVIFSWHGLGWIYAPLKSPYIITLLTVLAFVLPIHLANRNIPHSKKAKAIALLYLTSMLFYRLGKMICYSVYQIFLPLDFLIGYLILSLIIFLLLGYTYWFLSNRFLMPNKKKNTLLLAFMSLLTVPVSWVTVYIVPGYGSSYQWVDAVKMGYPVFWITLLLGISSIIIARNSQHS